MMKQLMTIMTPTSPISSATAAKIMSVVMIECKTQRFMGHSSGDPQVYRTKADVEALRKSGDPIARLEAELVASGLLDRARETAGIDAEVAEAIRFAEASPYPEAREVATDVYA